MGSTRCCLIALLGEQCLFVVLPDMRRKKSFESDTKIINCEKNVMEQGIKCRYQENPWSSVLLCKGFSETDLINSKVGMAELPVVTCVAPGESSQGAQICRKVLAWGWALHEGYYAGTKDVNDFRSYGSALLLDAAGSV